MTWAHDDMGYEPGDVRYNGDILAKAPPPRYPHVWVGRGTIFVTQAQARRAEVMGWRQTSAAHPDVPHLVKITRPT